ncbi:MAG TPA: metallophosphoesterase [Anaerolineae bacterium]
MLVVISDLHFEEEGSRNIVGDGSLEPIIVRRNIRLNAFNKIFDRLAAQAVHDGARKMDLVLAGDIFDLHRTALWFQNNSKQVRPYVSADQVDADLEAKVLEILHAINEPAGPVRPILEALQRLVQQSIYVDTFNVERSFPVPVELHFIPGNHDRLVNATPAIRRTVRQFLGLPDSAAPFRHVLVFDEERALIRHGHEYDHFNFSRDYRDVALLPLRLPEEAYDNSPFGDFITVDVASRISEEYRNYHGDQRILSDPLLRMVYERILEVDDLRPLRAIFNYLLYPPEPGYTPEQIWREAVRPVAINLLEAVHDHPFLLGWLEKLEKKGLLDIYDAVQAVLSLRAWRWGGLSLAKLQFLSDLSLRFYREEAGPQALAAREETIVNERHLFAVAGHTHRPKVELIGHPPAGEQYYVDTGTWRRRIPATPDFKSFGRIKSLTYAVLYGPEEDLGHPPVPGKLASLDYWSGVTQRWQPK